MSHQIDFCILGGGLAGLSLADSLADRDISCLIVEKNDIGSGASGTPGGLVNPATGRRAKKSWKAEQCYEAIAANLEKVQSEAEKKFYVNNGLLRPALLKKMARKMRRQHENTIWPDGWCQWKSEGEIKEIHPGITCVNGGLWLPIGLTVDVGVYMTEYARYLQKNGVKIITDQKPDVIQKEKGWLIELESETVRTKNLVFATGHYTGETKYWNWLPINLIKGQVAKFRSKNGALSFSHSISSLGYMARLDEDDTFVQGSTYEHDFEHLNPDKEGEQYLRKRMKRTLPELEPNCEIADQWAGVRTSTPNYKPILGLHPEYNSLHVFTGLGSKGLLYGKFLADHYADHITNGTPLFPEIAVSRFKKNYN